MDCLNDIVGVRGCGGSSALTYLNDLAGISVPDFDKAVTVEHKAAIPAFNNIISHATNLVIQNLNLYFNDKYTIKSFIEDEKIGYYYDNKVLMPAQAGQLVGYEIKVDKMANLAFTLNELSLFCDHSGVVPVKIYDLTQGKLLDTINITAVAGQIVTVTGLNKIYYTKKQRLRLFIGYESTFESYNTSWSSPYGINDNCNTCAGGHASSYVYFRSAQIPTSGPFIYSSLSGNATSGGAGLSFNYSLQCSFAEHLCNIRNLLAMPLLYKCGELVMKELRHSRRLTGIVTCYGKDYEKLEAEYKDDHDRMMSNLLLNARIPESICFSCNPKVKSRVMLP